MEQEVSDAGMAAFLGRAMEASALGIEVLAVTVIVVAIVFGTASFLLHLNGGPHRRVSVVQGAPRQSAPARPRISCRSGYRQNGRARGDAENVAVLGALVVVRTFLSWSLVVEIEGRWPWQAAAGGVTEE